MRWYSFTLGTKLPKNRRLWLGMAFMPNYWVLGKEFKYRTHYLHMGPIEVSWRVNEKDDWGSRLFVKF